MSNKKELINLHVHSAQGSLLDSILRIDEIVNFAVENNQKAIAITDHGTMNNFVNLVKACNEKGIKPIIGNEIYEVDDMTWKSDSKEYTQPRYHMVLLARTQEGLKNLFKITSISRTEGLYKKPRIDLDRIESNNLGKGIICLTACQAGRLSRYLERDMIIESEDFVNRLQSIFDYVAIELQSHNTPEQIKCNRLIYQFAKEHNLPFVVTTDAHMLSKEMHDSHSMFVEIGEGREVGESYTDCYLQNRKMLDEIMSNSFDNNSIIERAVEETHHIADMIKDIDIGLNKGNIMPKIEIDSGFNSHVDYLKHLVFSTFDEKFGHMSKEKQNIRRKRLLDELDVLEYVDYVDYFIMLYMLAKEARKRKIPLGYSRGSGAGCLCLFMLNVTQIDSVRWNLDFSRFANKGRKSLADYDWDIAKKRRKEMVEISEDLFGKENVAPICTFNTLSTKVAIRDVGKVLNEKEDSPYYQQIPYSLRDEVSKMIPTIKTLNDLGEEVEKELLLGDILMKNKKLEKIYNQFPLWFKYVMDLEGLPKSMGRHAAGTLITPNPITDYCAICLDSEKNVMVELEMHNAMDDLGLVKMDYLGLETLDIIDDCLKMAGLTWEDVDINHLNLDDKEVYDKVYKNGNTVGVFQMESAEARKMCMEAEADNIEDIIVVNAANRPGTKENFPIYCQNKLHPNDVEVIHDDLKELFKDSCSVLMYQEQALKVFRYAGFPEEEVDNARRCVDENTLVLLANGNEKKIKDINVGDEVASLSPYGYMSHNKVSNVFNNGRKDVIKISTSQSNEILCTEDHKILTQRGWVCAGELTKKDYIMTPNNIKQLKDIERSNKKPHSDIMFLLGMLIGDGTLGDSSLSFTNHETVLIKKYKDGVNKLLCNNSECKFTISEQFGVDVDKIYNIHISEKSTNYKNALKNLLEKYDLCHCSNNKYVPDAIMNYTKSKKLSYFIAGLFNTDGGYNLHEKRIEYYTTSKKLARQISSLLLKYNIYSYISRKNVKHYNYWCYTVMIQMPDSIKKFVEEFCPYIVGKKKQDYINIMNISNGTNKYNYLLPECCANEIREFIDNSDNSIAKIALKTEQYADSTLKTYKDNSLKISKNVCIPDLKAKKMISNIYAPKTYEILMSEYIPLKIKDIEYIGKKNVYDIEVENDHNYIANRLIVHNCIGKKDSVKMKELQVDLQNGLRSKSWAEEQINETWDLLLKQSGYSFNKSHACAYGLLSYLTAYLKVHYTIYFMSALLTSKSDKVEKISVIINDCKRMGIKVSPPNINLSNISFTPIPDKNEILFGLLGVKGLGLAILNKIIENRPYTSLNDFIEKVGDKTAIITLIKAGALPTNNKMKSLKKYATSLFNRREFTPLTTLPTYKKLKEDFGLDSEDYRIDKRKIDKDRLLEDYNKIRESKFIQTQNEKYKKHMISFQEKYAKDEYMWEFETLSMFLTNDPLQDAYKHTKVDWDLVKNGEKTTLFCVIIDIKRKKDKNGNQFAYLDLYTPFGIIEATIWSSQLKEFSELIKKGRCLAILGRKDEDDHFFVEKIKTYNTWLEERRNMGVNI